MLVIGSDEWVVRSLPPQQDANSFEQKSESPMAVDVKAYRPPAGETWRGGSGSLGLQ